MFIATRRQGPGRLVLASYIALVLSFSSVDSSFLLGSVLAQGPVGDQPAEHNVARPGGSTAGALGQARGYIDSGQLDAAIGALKNVIATASGSSELAQAYLLLAATYVKKRQPAEAIPYLESAVARSHRQEAHCQPGERRSTHPMPAG